MATVHFFNVLDRGVVLVFDDGYGTITTMNQFCYADDKPVIRSVTEFRLDYVNGVRQDDGREYPRLMLEMDNGRRFDGAVHIHETMHVIRDSWCWLAVRRGTDPIHDPFHARAVGRGTGGPWATRYFGFETGPVVLAEYDEYGLHIHDSLRGVHTSRYEWLLDWLTGEVIRSWETKPVDRD